MIDISSNIPEMGEYSPDDPFSRIEDESFLYAAEPQGSYTRRAFFNDYKAPGFYMLTFNINNGIMPLSIIKGNPWNYTIENTLSGNLVKEQIRYIRKHAPEIIVIRYVIMPDHVHLLLNVTARLDSHLLHKMGSFMTKCTSYYKKTFGISSDISVFQKPHDRIVCKKGQIDRLKKYIDDNPRRYIIKRQYSDLFKRHLHLNINGQEYASMGNIFLLNQYYLLPVIVHRKWSEEQKAKYHEQCLKAVSNGAILVSPFINRHEKEIRNEALKAGGNIIVIISRKIEERDKPQGKFFDLCAEGRILFLSPWQDKGNRKEVMDYESFHRMNAMAEAISQLDVNSRLSIVEGL